MQLYNYYAIIMQLVFETEEKNKILHHFIKYVGRTSKKCCYQFMKRNQVNAGYLNQHLC